MRQFHQHMAWQSRTGEAMAVPEIVKASVNQLRTLVTFVIFPAHNYSIIAPDFLINTSISTKKRGDFHILALIITY
jgi:hypothetical protein